MFAQESWLPQDDAPLGAGGKSASKERRRPRSTLPFYLNCYHLLLIPLPLQSHLKSCLYGLVHCPLKCGQGVTIKSLPSHMATECPRRVIACDHCEEDIVLESKAEHEAVCPRKPVVCAYCKNKGLLRGELKEHLERCELKPRNCRLIPLGCKFSVSLKNTV